MREKFEENSLVMVRLEGLWIIIMILGDFWS
jgi:hypothetical protein